MVTLNQLPTGDSRTWIKNLIGRDVCKWFNFFIDFIYWMAKNNVMCFSSNFSFHVLIFINFKQFKTVLGSWYSVSSCHMGALKLWAPQDWAVSYWGQTQHVLKTLIRHKKGIGCATQVSAIGRLDSTSWCLFRGRVQVCTHICGVSIPESPTVKWNCRCK